MDNKIKRALQRVEAPLRDIERTQEQQERISQMNEVIEQKFLEVEHLAE